MKYSNINLVLQLLIIIIISACKKQKENKDQNITNISIQETERRYLIGDLETILSGGRINTTRFKCSIVDTIDKKSFYILFNKDTCDKKIVRDGKITFTSKNGMWGDTGSELLIQYENYKTLNLLSKQHIIKTGSEKITNISGGLISDISNKGISVKYTIDISNMVKQEDGITYNWNESKIMTMGKNQNSYESIFKGTGKVDGDTSILEWGKTLDGKIFKSKCIEPIVLRFCATNWKIIKGKKMDHYDENNLTGLFTYGVNSTGTVVNDCNSFGYSIEWKQKNDNETKYQLLAHP